LIDTQDGGVEVRQTRQGKCQKKAGRYTMDDDEDGGITLHKWRTRKRNDIVADRHNHIA